MADNRRWVKEVFSLLKCYAAWVRKSSTHVFVPSSRVNRSEEDWTDGPLKMGLKGCPATSVITICAV